MNEQKDISGRKFSEQSRTEFAIGRTSTFNLKFEGDIVKIARYVDGKPSLDNPFVYNRIP